jgi:hypothetical protein
MATGRPLVPLTLSWEHREQLQTWSRRAKTAQALAMRSRIVLRMSSQAGECCCGQRYRTQSNKAAACGVFRLECLVCLIAHHRNLWFYRMDRSVGSRDDQTPQGCLNLF